MALDLSGMDLTDIYPIKVHTHLRFLHLGNNHLDNASLEVLANLPNLVSLYLNNNLVKSTTLPRFEYLQQLNLERNPIEQIDPIDQPLLQILVLNETRIKSLRYIGYLSTPILETLSAVSCRIENMIADYALTMVNLFLAYNNIKLIESLQGLSNLRRLHLRHNKISQLDGLTVGLDKLEYLNLRENQITDPHEIKKIKSLPSLSEILLMDNPVDDEMGSDIRPMVLMYSLELARINKKFVNDEEVEYARSLIYEVEAEEEDIYLEGAHPGEDFDD
ncbi:hypothetical protein O3M35_000575 [Rhynocoris fuscipes]|uniref:Leucine-rich repeat-containing protein 23 n=1 Tax=Rhynocoris fuscipes TaxID=488301 RepID=A0AAW1DN30_9HEMI